MEIGHAQSRTSFYRWRVVSPALLRQSWSDRPGSVGELEYLRKADGECSGILAGGLPRLRPRSRRVGLEDDFAVDRRIIGYGPFFTPRSWN